MSHALGEGLERLQLGECCICDPTVQSFSIMLSYDSLELFFEMVPQGQLGVDLEDEFKFLYFL